jgi:hypothetical protein
MSKVQSENSKKKKRGEQTSYVKEKPLSYSEVMEKLVGTTAPDALNHPAPAPVANPRISYPQGIVIECFPTSWTTDSMGRSKTDRIALVTNGGELLHFIFDNGVAVFQKKENLLDLIN